MRYSLLEPALCALWALSAQASPLTSAAPLEVRGTPGETIACIQGKPFTLAVSDVEGNWRWTWTADRARQHGVNAALQKCIDDGSRQSWFQEAKWIRQGEAILTIFNNAALMIKRNPNHADDGKVLWGTCLDHDGMGNTHSLEMLPGHRIAVATTGSSTTGAVLVFNADAQDPLDAYAKPIQRLDGISACHAVLWDHAETQLWAAGSSSNPARPNANPADSAPLLVAYKWDGAKNLFASNQPSKSLRISPPRALTEEWWPNAGSYWWSGAHDLAGVPGERKLLIAVDDDIHSYDIKTGKFASGDAVANEYLGGFRPVDAKHTNTVTRSDIKSITLDANRNVIYTQAGWGSGLGSQYTVLSGGRFYTNEHFGGYPGLYKVRWFSDVPGWPKART